MKKLSNCSIKEFYNILNQAIQNGTILQYKDQLFEYENYKKLCLIDKTQNAKWLSTLFQFMEDEYVPDKNRVAARISLEYGEDAYADAGTNIISMPNYTDLVVFDNTGNPILLDDTFNPDKCRFAEKGFIMYHNFFLHENQHMDDYAIMKYQKSPNPHMQTYQNQISQNIGQLQTSNNSHISLTESDLHALLIAHRIDEIIDNKITPTNNKKELYDAFRYLNIKELRARINEKDTINTTLNNIDNVSDIKVRLELLQKYQEETAKNYVNKYMQYVENNFKNKALDEYFAFCKNETRWSSKDHKIYNKELFEQTTRILLADVYNIGKTFCEQMQTEIDNITTTLANYSIQPQFARLNASIDDLFDPTRDTYALLRANTQETTTALKELNNSFNLDFLKYKTFEDKPQREHNLKYITDKLYEIYNEIDSYVYDSNTNKQMKSDILNTLCKILREEKNIYLLDAEIDDKIYSLVNKESIFIENVDTAGISDIIQDIRDMQALKEDKMPAHQLLQHMPPHKNIADQILG